MRRLPPAAWIAAPLVLALTYAGAHALLAPSPGLADVVPRAAVVTLRFRGLAALDELWFLARADERRPSEFLGEQRNLPGLAGVSPTGPVHFVLLPPAGRHDPTLLILPVEDAAALSARFQGRDVPEALARGLERHPHHLEVRGDFAALAWDREIVRRLGEGGVTLADRGEDLGVAVAVPGAVALALTLGGQAPWRPLLEALGARPDQAAAEVDAATGRRRLTIPAGRTARVGLAWRTARLWAYRARGEVEVELEPADPALAAHFAAVAGDRREDVHARAGAAAALEIPSRAARRALQAALEAAGARLPAPAAAVGEAAGLAVSAFVNPGDPRAWTLAIEAFGGPLPDLSEIVGPLPAVGASRAYGPGEAPVTLCDLRGATVAPGGSAVRPAGEPPLLLVGPEAETLAPRLPVGAHAWTLALPAGEALVARFALAAPQIAGLLGPAVTRGGLLAVLGGGDLEGLVTTDGARLKMRVARRAR